MIKTLKEDVEKITIGIEEVLDDTALWPLWYFLKGHVFGCVCVYWFLVIAALITGKKWNLVNKEEA